MRAHEPVERRVAQHGPLHGSRGFHLASPYARDRVAGLPRSSGIRSSAAEEPASTSNGAFSPAAQGSAAKPVPPTVDAFQAAPHRRPQPNSQTARHGHLSHMPPAVHARAGTPAKRETSERRRPARPSSALARARESRGQSTVELALVLPLLALVLFACLKVGLAFFSYEQVASAANAAARAAAVNHGGDPTVAARSGRAVDLSNARADRLPDQRDATSSTAAPPGAAWSYPGTVTVTVDYPVTFSFLGQLPQTFDLQASATKRLER